MRGMMKRRDEAAYGAAGASLLVVSACLPLFFVGGGEVFHLAFVCRSRLGDQRDKLPFISDFRCEFNVATTLRHGFWIGVL